MAESTVILQTMAYPGSKQTATHVLEILNDTKYDNMDYLEPFVGLGHVLYRIKNKKSIVATDISTNVVDILTTLQTRKSYPIISCTIFDSLKQDKQISKKELQGYSVDIMKSFASISTFNGINWRHSGFSYPSRCGRKDSSVTRHNYYNKLIASDAIEQAKLSVKSYTYHKPNGSLIFCDPPYAHSTRYNKKFYGMSELFDHDKFWETMRAWSYNNIVYISESSAPSDFEIVASKHRKVTFAKNNNLDTNSYTDNLYMYKGYIES